MDASLWVPKLLFVKAHTVTSPTTRVSNVQTMQVSSGTIRIFLSLLPVHYGYGILTCLMGSLNSSIALKTRRPFHSFCSITDSTISRGSMRGFLWSMQLYKKDVKMFSLSKVFPLGFLSCILLVSSTLGDFDRFSLFNIVQFYSLSSILAKKGQAGKEMLGKPQYELCLRVSTFEKDFLRTFKLIASKHNVASCNFCFFPGKRCHAEVNLTRTAFRVESASKFF